MQPPMTRPGAELAQGVGVREVHASDEVWQAPHERLIEDGGDAVVDAETVGDRGEEWSEAPGDHGQVVDARAEGAEASGIEERDAEEDGDAGQEHLADVREHRDRIEDDGEEEPCAQIGGDDGAARGHHHEEHLDPAGPRRS